MSDNSLNNFFPDFRKDGRQHRPDHLPELPPALPQLGDDLVLGQREVLRRRRRPGQLLPRPHRHSLHSDLRRAARVHQFPKLLSENGKLMKCKTYRKLLNSFGNLINCLEL